MALWVFNEMDFDRFGKANDKRGLKTLANNHYHFSERIIGRQQVHMYRVNIILMLDYL